jgi:hypothetical protein
MTVAEINRLEQAARMAMGGFQDSATVTLPHPNLYSGALRAVALAFAAISLILVACYVLQ